MKNIYKRLPMLVFIGFIGAMFVLFLALPKKEYSSSEKRYLQKAPAFSFKSFFSDDKNASFQNDFEDYIEDHTAGRNFWVGLSSYMNYVMGNNASSGVYLCKNGYLVNDPEDMSGLDRNIGFIEEFAASCPVDTTVLIAPSTGYVCSDILPQVHDAYRDDELFPQMKEALGSADFIDLRETFIDEYEEGNQIFYKTDHHWTSYGAFTAYRELADSLGYTPHIKRDYRIKEYPDFYGTTYSTSGFWLAEPDVIEVWDNPENDGNIVTTIIDGGEETSHKDMFYPDHLEEDDKYPIFLDGNHPYTVITNSGADSDKKLLVVKDSFAHSLVPFLADHYSEIIMVDLRYYTSSVSDIIDREGIDQVLVLYSIDNLATDSNLGWLQ